MTNTTAAEAPPMPDGRPGRSSPGVWKPDDVPIIARIRKDATAADIDWRSNPTNVGPSFIQAIVDEMRPGPKKCGVSRANRLRDLLLVVPEPPADEDDSTPEPPAAPVAVVPAPILAPVAPELRPAPAPVPAPRPERTPEALPVPTPPAPVVPVAAPATPEPEPESTPEPEPPAPEPTPEPEPEAPEYVTAPVAAPEPESTGAPALPEPRYSRLRRFAAGAGIVAVAVVAGMISYSHQKALAAEHGQDGILAAAWPLAVDGLVLSCGILVAVDRLRGFKPRFWAFMGFWLGVVASVACNALAGDGGWLGRAISAFPAIALLIAVEALTTGPKRRAKRIPRNV